MVKDLGFKVVMAVYIILFKVDLVTTLMNTQYLQHLEANPVYQLVGSLWPIVLINYAAIFGLYWLYKKSVDARFLVMNVMVITIMARCIAIYNAVHWIKSDATVEQVAAYATDEVMRAFQWQFVIIMYAPLILTFITYIFWRIDHKVFKKGGRLK